MSLSTLFLAEWTWYLFNFDFQEDLFNACRSLFIWITLALVVVFLIALAASKKNRALVVRCGVTFFIVYAAALAILFSVLTFRDDADNFTSDLLVPLLVACGIVIVCAVLNAVLKIKPVRVLTAVLLVAAAVYVLVALGFYYATGNSLEMNWLTEDKVNTVGLYVSAALVVIAIIVLAFAFDKGKKGFTTRSISYAAVCIALSFALSYLRLMKMPQGGSVTLASLLPLMLYSYMFGTKKGVFAGAIYGLLQAVQDPYILHPAQFVLDYPVAFAAIGLSGMFAGSKVLKAPALRFALGAIVGGVGRFISHFFSGMFAFGAFAAEGQTPAEYSLLYNSFVFPDVAIVIVVGVLVLLSKSFSGYVEKVRLSQTLSDRKAKAAR